MTTTATAMIKFVIRTNRIIWDPIDSF